MTDRFIKLKEVCRLTSLSPATIYRMMSAGEFPRQIKIGAAGKNGAVVWLESAIIDWMQRTESDANVQSLESCLKPMRRESKWVFAPFVQFR